MRVALYVRVSTQHQAQTQTIEQQLDRLRAHAHAQGWLLPDEHIFRDDGFSGASLHRPGLERLREQVAAGALDRLLLTAPDRLEAAEVLFDLPPLVFPRPGRYEFQVAADGAFLGAIFMDAVLIAAPTR